MKSRTFVFASLLTAVAASVHATDGVKLIGKKATYPIVIDTPGSYRLKRNITVPNANTTAIQITADNVTLDLNGFVVQGPASCTCCPVACSNTGTGIGIDAQTAEGVTLKNGVVTGMGNNGVLLLAGRVEDVRAHSNGLGGITILSNYGQSRVQDCEASFNLGYGIQVGQGIVAGNVVSSNGDSGIHISNAGVVRDNHAEGNGADGIETSGSAVVVVNNSSAVNLEAGIDALGVIAGNAVSDNFDDGIIAGDGGSVVGNAVHGNAGYGLLVNDSGYAFNSAQDNNSGGPQVDGGIAMSGNLCSGALCP